MNVSRKISEFGAAMEEVTQGLFNNVKAFASLVGFNPALPKIIGKIMHYAVIQKNGSAVPPDKVHGLHATFGFAHV